MERIRKDDTVMLVKNVTGAKDPQGRPVGKESRGTRSRVLYVYPKQDRVLVENINYVWKHVRKSQKAPQGGRLQKEAPVPASVVMWVCPSCDKPARPTVKTVEQKGKKKQVRTCRRCGAEG